MRGLLADVNVAAHAEYLGALFESLGLSPVLVEANLVVQTFSSQGIAPDADDRFLWNFCQVNGWVFFTDNRNDDGPDSHQSTLSESWIEGCLPVVTLGSKTRFENDDTYRNRVAEDVAELLFGVSIGEYRSQPRIYVPLSRPR